MLPEDDNPLIRAKEAAADDPIAPAADEDRVLAPGDPSQNGHADVREMCETTLRQNWREGVPT